jgi:hypothetical protein
MFILGALRPLLVLWATVRRDGLRYIPRAQDRPCARTCGVDSIKVLLIGSGLGAGWGVHTHDRGLIGSLPRAIARRCAGAVSTNGIVATHLRLADVGQMLPAVALDRFAVVCAALGENDALAFRSSRAWRRQTHDLLDSLAAHGRDSLQVVVGGLPPVTSVPIYRDWIGRRVERHVARLNEITRALCETRTRVSVVSLFAVAGNFTSTSQAVAQYELSAEQLASGLDPADAWKNNEPPSQAWLEMAASARTRVFARMTHVNNTEAFNRIVRRAASVFRVANAALMIAGPEVIRDFSRHGFNEAAISADRAFSRIVVESPEPLIVADAQADPRFRDRPSVGGELGIRFFAAYPVRNVLGYPIGTFCIGDSEPLEPDWLATIPVPLSTLTA